MKTMPKWFVLGSSHQLSDIRFMPTWRAIRYNVNSLLIWKDTYVTKYCPCETFLWNISQFAARSVGSPCWHKTLLLIKRCHKSIITFLCKTETIFFIWYFLRNSFSLLRSKRFLFSPIMSIFSDIEKTIFSIFLIWFRYFGY